MTLVFNGGPSRPLRKKRRMSMSASVWAFRVDVDEPLGWEMKRERERESERDSE